MRYAFFLVPLILLAAEPQIQVLDVWPGATTLEIVFNPGLINAAGQAIASDCKITSPAALQKGPGALSFGTRDRISIPLNSPMVAETKLDVFCEKVEYYVGAAKKTAKKLKASYTVPTSRNYAQVMLQKMEKQAKATTARTV